MMRHDNDDGTPRRVSDILNFNQFATTWIGITCGLGSGALAGYWHWTHSGPFRWLVNLQLATWGSYIPSLTVVGLALILWLLTWAALAVPASAGLLGSWNQLSRAKASERVEQLRAWNDSGLTHKVMLLVLGAVGAVAGVGLGLWSMISPGKIVMCSAAEIEASGPPASRYLDIEGVLRHELTMTMEGRPTYHYIPLVSPGWTEQQPIGVFLKVAQKERSKMPRPESSDGLVDVVGMTGLGGLDGVVGDAFREGGYNVDRAIEVDFNMTPQASAQRWWIMAGLGAAFALYGGFGVYRSRRS